MPSLPKDKSTQGMAGVAKLRLQPAKAINACVLKMIDFHSSSSSQTRSPNRCRQLKNQSHSPSRAVSERQSLESSMAQGMSRQLPWCPYKVRPTKQKSVTDEYGVGQRPDRLSVKTR